LSPNINPHAEKPRASAASRSMRPQAAALLIPPQFTPGFAGFIFY
jgi:hypothetical protein